MHETNGPFFMRIIRKASFNAGGIITDKKLVSPPIQYLFSATKI